MYILTRLSQGWGGAALEIVGLSRQALATSPPLKRRSWTFQRPVSLIRNVEVLRPVLAVGEGGPGRAADLDGLVEARGRVVDDPHADEVDADPDLPSDGRGRDSVFPSGRFKGMRPRAVS